MNEIPNEEQWLADKSAEVERVVDRHTDRLHHSLNYVFERCDVRLARLDQKWGVSYEAFADYQAFVRQEQTGSDYPERYVSPGTVEMLAEMTDSSLLAHGYDPSNPPTPVMLHTFKHGSPGLGYSLKIFSITDGIIGFNTGSDDGDNSRRWSVHIDRGVFRGSAFDNKGAVYAHGKHQLSPYHHNIQTGPIEELIADFYSNYVEVEVKALPNIGRKAGTDESSEPATSLRS